MKKKKVLKTRHVHKSSRKKNKKLRNKKIIHRRKSKKIVRHYKKRIKKVVKRHYKKRAPKVAAVAVVVVETPEVVPTHAFPPAEKTLVKRGRRGKGTSVDKMYFTKDTEDSIIAYNATTEQPVREEIYNTKIKYPFEKLVENIFNTFKFSYFETGPLDVQKETVAHLVSNIHKFEAGKGKAFSYFSIIAKHYLIALNNTTYKRRNQHVEIGEEHDEHTVQLQTEDKYYKDAEMKEFMNLMIAFWENNVGKIFTKQRDLDIANAVIELFRQTQNISMFNKKALYLYIREISCCKTQQITKVINRMRQYQTNISKSYLNRGVVNIDSYIKG
jgi:hypothetical protein